MIKRYFSNATLAAILTALLHAENIEAQSEIFDVESAQVSRPPYEYTLEYAKNTFDRFFETEQYTEAIDAGKLVVTLLLEQEDYDNLHWSRALRQLASAQRHAGELVPAIQNYKMAIQVIESKSDRLNPMLVDPLWELSQTYVDAGDLEIAASSYERTFHIHRVNHGLNNVEQMDLLAEMSEVYFQLDDYSRANALQKFCVNLAMLNYPGNSLLKLPALYSRADMLIRTGENLKSQRLYRQIMRLIQGAEGSKSLTLLPVLHKLADYSLYDETTVKYAGLHQILHYLRRAVKIAEQHEDATALQKADAHLAMGGFLALKTADRAAAMRNYRKAWDWLSADDELRAERDKRFAEPVALNDVPAYRLPLYLGLKVNSGDTGNNGIVVVTYDVSRKGRIENMRVTESHPAGYKDYTVIKHLRNIAFRPRFVEREPTAAVDRRYEVRYSYRDEDLPEKFHRAMTRDAAVNVDE